MYYYVYCGTCIYMHVVHVHTCTMYTCTGHMYDVHVLHVVVCEDNNKKVKKSTQIKLFLLNYFLTTCTVRALSDFDGVFFGT